MSRNADRDTATEIVRELLPQLDLERTAYLGGGWPNAQDVHKLYQKAAPLAKLFQPPDHDFAAGRDARRLCGALRVAELIARFQPRPIETRILGNMTQSLNLAHTAAIRVLDYAQRDVERFVQVPHLNEDPAERGLAIDTLR